MSSAHRSARERREDQRAASVRTPEDNARALVEGRLQQAEIIAQAEELGLLSPSHAAELRLRYGITKKESTK